MNVDIQVLQSHELSGFKELIAVFERVFEMENFKLPNDFHLQNLMNKNTFFAIVARTNNKIIGGLTLYILDQYYSVKPLAYMYDLAVLPEFQRKGVGKSLVEFTKKFCMEKGFEEVFVQADKVDDYASDFYRTTNPTNEEDVIHFYYSLDS